MNLTMEHEECFGIKVILAEAVTFLPYLLQLVLATLKIKNISYLK